MEKYIGIKGFIVDEKHLIVAKGIKEALFLAVAEGIVNEDGLQVMPMGEDMLETVFYRRIGDLNNTEEVKALLTFYKDESISLSYNGKYVLSQETVGGYIRSTKEEDALLLCSKETLFNQVVGEDTWMKADKDNPVELKHIIIEDEVEIKESEEEIQAPWDYAIRRN